MQSSPDRGCWAARPRRALLAIRAFGATTTGAESTSFVLLKGLNYAVEQGAQIINMSFAGPKDPLLERGLAAAAKRGIILIAAAGNAGPKSPPLYPAADRNVIAVTATDASNKLFEASNRGSHLALAAPGVDLLLPSPDEKYQVASGTSFAAAYVSGLAALIVERNPGVAPEVVRRILTDTAGDLGPERQGRPVRCGPRQRPGRGSGGAPGDRRRGLARDRASKANSLIYQSLFRLVIFLKKFRTGVEPHPGVP